MESADSKEVMNNSESKFNQEIHSKVVRAGKRTYFFDVKSTRKDEYYLTITESKKRFTEGGKFHFEKHKIFLYKEDFDKFADSLQEIIEYIRNNQPELKTEETITEPSSEVSEEVVAEKEASSDYTSIEFEDI